MVSTTDGVKLASDGNYYYWNNSKRTWNEAFSFCKNELSGARLAIVKSRCSFEAIKAIDPPAPRFWVAATREKKRNSSPQDWYWIDEKDEKEYVVETDFTKFAGLSNGQGESCLTQKSDGWHDAGCQSIKFPFFCQIPRKSKFEC